LVESKTSTSAEKILEAARRVVRRGGPDKLTLSAVAIEAGVSRPTLYRWFPSRPLLLGALAAHETERFDRGLLRLAEAHPDPRERFDAALRYIVAYLDDRGGPDTITATDAAFALQSMGDSHAAHVASIARVLGDALEQIPAVASGAMTHQQGAEMLLRIAYSNYVVPSTDIDQLLATVRAFAGAAPLARRRRR
jgi:TetR/AcrR family transcriptional regulator, repressor for uid operon